MDRRETTAVAIEDQAGDPVPSNPPRLEVNQVTGLERRLPPCDEWLARPEGEVQSLTGLEEEVVEPIECDLGSLIHGREPATGPIRADTGVVTNDELDRVLRLPDPLARRLGDPGEHVVLRPAGQ